MTLDQLQQRDARIADLEALGRARTPDQQDEYGRLMEARVSHWNRLPDMLANARRKIRELEAYARQQRLPLDGAA